MAAWKNGTHMNVINTDQGSIALRGVDVPATRSQATDSPFATASTTLVSGPALGRGEAGMATFLRSDITAS